MLQRLRSAMDSRGASTQVRAQARQLIRQMESELGNGRPNTRRLRDLSNKCRQLSTEITRSTRTAVPRRTGKGPGKNTGQEAATQQPWRLTAEEIQELRSPGPAGGDLARRMASSVILTYSGNHIASGRRRDFSFDLGQDVDPLNIRLLVSTEDIYRACDDLSPPVGHPDSTDAFVPGDVLQGRDPTRIRNALFGRYMQVAEQAIRAERPGVRITARMRTRLSLTIVRELDPALSDWTRVREL
ncbi:TPA: hypothetical protein EYP38_03090 [Candidatus Micrarchaeota archaeon]|nr:hypothetical protein [Candidatus Micrarchaeota archaeon]